MMDILNLACLKKLGLPKDSNWNWGRSEAINGGFLVEGSETTLDKKGRKTYRPKKEWTKILLTDQDLTDQKIEYEQTTGKCYYCEGTGMYNYGWDIKEGTLKKKCTYCSSTGNSTVHKEDSK